MINEYLQYLHEGPSGASFKTITKKGPGIAKNIAKGVGIGAGIIGAYGATLYGVYKLADKIFEMVAKSEHDCTRTCFGVAGHGAGTGIGAICYKKCLVEAYSKAISELKKIDSKCKNEKCHKHIDKKISKIQKKLDMNKAALRHMSLSPELLK